MSEKYDMLFDITRAAASAIKMEIDEMGNSAIGRTFVRKDLAGGCCI